MTIGHNKGSRVPPYSLFCNDPPGAELPLITKVSLT